MKLEEGMYVRTKKGCICQILRETYSKYISRNKELCYEVDKPINVNMELYDEDILKASHNIIDLIEVGDYVNGILVKQLPLCKNDFIYGEAVDGIKPVIGVVGTPIEDNKDGFVKSIVTKEQFEQMEYKVGE